MSAWLDMGADQFDRRLGTRAERRLAARLRDQPDTLLPELAEVQLTARGKAPDGPPRVPGEVPLFGDDDQDQR